jgi:hypothetical protein
LQSCRQGDYVCLQSEFYIQISLFFQRWPVILLTYSDGLLWIRLPRCLLYFKQSPMWLI